jgi:hypothetical protein
MAESRAVFYTAFGSGFSFFLSAFRILDTAMF